MLAGLVLVRESHRESGKVENMFLQQNEQLCNFFKNIYNTNFDKHQSKGFARNKKSD